MIGMVVLAFTSPLSVAEEKAAPPKELVEVLEFYVGDWSVTGSLGGERLKGKASFRMPAGKHCTLGTVNCRSKDGPIIFSLVSGWDSSTGWYTEQGLAVDGGVYSVFWSRVSDTTDAGKQVETFEGRKVTAVLTMERKSEDEFVVTCAERTAGDEKLPDLKFVYHRETKDKAKPKARK
jgi:hypothetical protein